MQTSKEINELSEALSKAQGEMKHAAKDSDNPFFGSKYADLAAVLTVAREPMAKNGLALVQYPSVIDGRVCVETVLTHASGQYLSGVLQLLPVKDDPQGIGSAITYARRYSAAAVLGIAQDDDDGNAASGKDAGDKPETPKKTRAKQSTDGANPDPASVKTECKALADKLGLPAASRAALLADQGGDLDKVKTALTALLAARDTFAERGHETEVETGGA
ncbi:MAG: ERF family protein [Terriglobia bacterium]